MNLKRYFLMFIICISSFMIYTNNVYAYTDNQDIQSLGYSTIINLPNNAYGYTIKPNASRAWKGREGWVLFTFSYYSGVSNTSTTNPVINAVNVFSGNQKFVCDIGTVSSYTDSTKVYLAYTAKCPVKLTSNYGFSGIEFEKLLTGVGTIRLSGVVSFYDNASDVTSVVNAINSASSSITSLMATINGQEIERHTETINAINNILTALQSSNTTQQQIKNNSEEIKNDLKDSSIDNDSTSSSTSGWASKNASNGTITQLLTLPISLLTNITNSINSSCSSFSLGTLFDTELVLPCINLQDYLGSALVSIIDILFCGFMIYNIAKKLIRIFNDFTNLKSNQIDEIYGGANE